MATFAYNAIDKAGRRRRGTVTASSRRLAREQLRREGLRVESVEERATPTTTQTLRSGRYRSQLTSAMRELATLLQAGVPLLTAIDSILAQSRRGFHDAMLGVRDRVSNGESLADAMASDPGVFDEMTIGMVRVGEHAGNLDEVCEQVADFRERSGELRDRVVSALIYPTIVLIVSVGVTLFLMTVVVPMLLTNLVELDRPLPTPTKILKFLSDSLLSYGHWLLLGLAGLCVAVALPLRSEHGKRRLEEWSLRTPILGSLLQKQSLSRMTLVVSSLMRSGVELVDAIEIAERSSTSRVLRSSLQSMRSDLSAGHDLKEAASKHAIFPPALVQVFSLGQQSGQLDKMLSRLGSDYDRQSAQLATRLTTIAEPALILFLSVIVGFILFATILPILEAGNVLSG